MNSFQNEISISSNENLKYQIEDNYKNTLFTKIEIGDLSSLKKIMLSEEFSGIQFWKYFEKDNNTLLQRAIFFNMTEISFKILNEAYKRLREDIVIFKSWVNNKNIHGFTSLHYAVFRGNFLIISELIEKGADIEQRNNLGLNLMHVAAQGDQPGALIFLKEKYMMSAAELDKGHRTPLHWAVYTGSELSIDFLLSWGVNINAQDNEGWTPLHIAVMENKIKIAKKLVKMGADITILDKKGHKAIDIARTKRNQGIINLLKTNINIMTCNFNQQRAVDDIYSFPIFFFLYFLYMELLTYVMILPHLNSRIYYHVEMPLLLTVLLSYFLLSKSDPGRIENKLVKSLARLVMEGKTVRNVCPWCVCYKSMYTKHCYYCKECVEYYDHHCIWIKNCIGRKNIKMFTLFLFLVAAKLGLCIGIAMENLFTQSSYLVPVTQFPFSKFPFLYTATVKAVSSSSAILSGVVVLIPVIALFIAQLKKYYRSSQNLQPGVLQKSTIQEYSVVLIK